MIRKPDQSDHSLSLFFNPFWKALARHLASKCKKCEQKRLLSVFDIYSKSQHFHCKGCLLTSIVLMPLIHLLFFHLRVDNSTVKRLLGDSLIRKCMLSVVKGIANFGIRYPQPTGAPITIVWNFTNRCNLNCLHCHQDSSPTSSYPELTTPQAFKVIDNMSDAGVAILTFSGGEPLLRADLYDAIKRASDSGMLCTIASNGTLITREVAKKLAKVGIRRVEIGLDGATAETHDFLRNKPGSFEATIEGIRNCATVGFDELATTMTLHSKNISELEETMDLAEKLGATRFYLNRLIPQEIWVRSELLNYIRNRKALEGSCKICEYSALCGGCRYTAYITHGDWLGPDASCPFGPKIPNA